MYRSTTKNIVILGVATVTFLALLSLVCSQQTVGDPQYLHVMIPHYSIEI